MRKISTIGAALVTGSTLFFAGCGGGGGGSASVGTAQYVDSAVEGVSYRCGGESGTTGQDGTFHFERGKGCTFTLGNITLRTLEANALVDGGVILETDPAVGALLQSLDADGDPDNGIQIRGEVVKTLEKEGVLQLPKNDEALSAIIEKVRAKHPGLKIKPVSFTEAAGHINKTYARYANSDKSHDIRLTDENAFNQYATGPVLYSIPVLAKELPLSQYGLKPLTDSEFENLSDEQKYKVAIKLYGSLFYGIDFDRFGQTVLSGRFIRDTWELFNRENTPAQIAAVEAKVAEYYHDDGYYNPYKLMGQMLARLYEMEPGKAYVNRWAAYVLTQTILFSPAYELDTVYTVDSVDV
ncbi:hypothetical protein, partial [Hydrogenimonas sp.]